jgi:type IV pilus assembly protein PilE
MRSTVQGFTLMEAMAAMAIAGVLSAVALPSLEAQLRKARRADVLVAVAQIQGAQERLRSRGTRYGNLAEIGATGLSTAGHYTLQITAFDADGYALLATAGGAQANDIECRFMAARATGMNLTHASGADASLANAEAANRRCWSL